MNCQIFALDISKMQDSMEKKFFWRGAMKMIRFKARRPIWKWFAVFGLSFALAAQALGGSSLL